MGPVLEVYQGSGVRSLVFLFLFLLHVGDVACMGTLTPLSFLPGTCGPPRFPPLSCQCTRYIMSGGAVGGAGAASGGLDLWLLVEFGHLGDRDVGERALVRADLRQLRAWEKEVSGPLFRSEQGLEKGS